MNELRIQGLSLDSRRVNPGDLFIALSGTVDDGQRYIPEAIAKGAVAVLIEPSHATAEAMASTLPKQVPIIKFQNLRNSISSIAGRFFSDPSKQMSVIAITGTNGKTSISHFIAQIFDSLNQPCGVMGTLGNGFLKTLRNSNDTINTTTDPISAQKELALMKEQKARVVAMEVTSHALTQGRVEGLQFQSAIFTNLTRDHLDYHGDMQSYFAAKKRLFIELYPKNIIINLEDEYGCLLLNEILNLRNGKALENNDVYKEMSKIPKIIAYTTVPELASPYLQNQLKDPAKAVNFVVAKDLLFTEEGIQATIETPWGTGLLECPLLGRFNLSNVLAALTAVCLEQSEQLKKNEEHGQRGLHRELGEREQIEQEDILPKVLVALKSLKTVAGRMSRFGGSAKEPVIVVDYAHTPDALSQVLQALRLHCRGKLWCVFGCGGDRDRGKRPEMAAMAEKFSDNIIVTQDNPRTEDPDNILQNIMQGFKMAKKIKVIPSRKEAIDFAVKHAAAEDMILVAGKGHEDYQIIGSQKLPFSDQHEVLQALSRRIL